MPVGCDTKRVNLTDLNFTIAIKIAQSRTWDPGENKSVIGLGNHITLTPPKKFTMVVRGEKITLKGRREPGGRFRSQGDMQLLLSKGHMRLLRMDLNVMMKNLEHEDVRYLPVDEAEERGQEVNTVSPAG